MGSDPPMLALGDGSQAASVTAKQVPILRPPMLALQAASSSWLRSWCTSTTSSSWRLQVRALA